VLLALSASGLGGRGAGCNGQVDDGDNVVTISRIRTALVKIAFGAAKIHPDKDLVIIVMPHLVKPALCSKSTNIPKGYHKFPGGWRYTMVPS
jgi:hypothetical protein